VDIYAREARICATSGTSVGRVRIGTEIGRHDDVPGPSVGRTLYTADTSKQGGVAAS
jgi:hypothetical protein